LAEKKIVTKKQFDGKFSVFNYMIY